MTNHYICKKNNTINMNKNQITLSHKEVAYLLGEKPIIHEEIFSEFLSQDSGMRELTLEEISKIYPKMRSVDPRYDGKCSIEFLIKDLDNVVKNKELGKKANIKRGYLTGVIKNLILKILGDDYLKKINENLARKKSVLIPNTMFFETMSGIYLLVKMPHNKTEINIDKPKKVIINGEECSYSIESAVRVRDISVDEIVKILDHFEEDGVVYYKNYTDFEGYDFRQNKEFCFTNPEDSLNSLLIKKGIDPNGGKNYFILKTK